MKFSPRAERSFSGTSFVAVAFFFVTGACLLSVTDSSACLWIILLAALAQTAFCLLKSRKKIFWIAATILAIVWITALCFWFDGVGTGLKILANQLFAKSEASQAYRYHYFTVSVVRKLYPFYIRLAVAFVAFPLAVCFFAAGCEKNGIVLFVLCLLLALFCAVFGVFASVGWLIALAVVALICPFVSRCGGDKKTVALSLAAVLCLGTGIFCVSAVCYRPSETVSNFSESIRDLFDEKEKKEDGGTGGAQGEGQGSAGGESGTGSELATTVRRFPVALLIFGGIAVAICLIPLGKRIRGKLSRRKIKKLFSAEDAAVAVRAYFLLTTNRLRRLGVAGGNKGYRNYGAEIGEAFGLEYAEAYDEAVRRYEKACYSDEKGTEEDRLFAKKFYERTLQLKKGGRKHCKKQENG